MDKIVEKKNLFVALSPALLPLYPVQNSIVVVIDILRATSTIVMAMHNGAKWVVPVDSIEACIAEGKKMNALTAGERDGKIIPGLSHGNSPLEYEPQTIADKVLVITTTNGTKLLHQAFQQQAVEIVIGSFLNISAVCEYLRQQNHHVILACAGWKDKINIEDALFAGAVVNKLKGDFNIDCDSAMIAETLYQHEEKNKDTFIPQISHYQRLAKFGLEKDIEFCFQHDKSICLPIFDGEKLVLWT